MGSDNYIMLLYDIDQGSVSLTWLMQYPNLHNHCMILLVCDHVQTPVLTVSNHFIILLFMITDTY
jgi:hypothetical protein